MRTIFFALLGVVLVGSVGARPVGAQPSGEAMACEDANCPELTLDAFLDQVLRSNPEVQAIRLASDRASATVLDARGGFDPMLISEYEYKTQEDKDKLNVLRSGVDLPVNTWMSPKLKLDYRRGLGSSIDPSVATSQVGETRLGLEVSPLSGILTDPKRAKLRKARLEPRRATAMQAKERNKLLLEAAKAYWTWVEAQRKLQINRDLLDIATERENFITRRARIGEEAAIDSVEAELAAVSQEGKVADALRKAEQTGLKLATFLWETDGTAASFAFAPPPPPSLPSVDTPEPDAIQTALAGRPELRMLDVKQQQLRIEQRLARAQIRPDLKLQAQAVSYEDSPLDVTDVKVGFSIDQPLLFRSDRGEAERAQIETLEISFKRQVTERKIEADVQVALVGLRQARRRVDAAERRVELASRLRQAEQRRFELGESTLFLLNQREKSFAEAREELAAARIDVFKAYAEYQWATGTIADPYVTTAF